MCLIDTTQAVSSAYTDLIAGDDFRVQGWICGNRMIAIEVPLLAVDFHSGASGLLDLLNRSALVTKHQSLRTVPCSQHESPASEILCS